MQVKEISRNKVQTDALDIAINNERATLGISMGVGKTRIAINHLIKLYDPFIRVLVVVPKWSVKDSWEVELVKMNLFVQLDEHIEYTTYLSLNKHNPNDYEMRRVSDSEYKEMEKRFNEMDQIRFNSEIYKLLKDNNIGLN